MLANRVRLIVGLLGAGAGVSGAGGCSDKGNEVGNGAASGGSDGGSLGSVGVSDGAGSNVADSGIADGADASGASDASVASDAGTGFNTGGGADASGNVGEEDAGGVTKDPLPPHAIAATGRGTCALDSAGQIHCWGAMGGQIQQGPFVELHASPEQVCAVRADRTVECLGDETIGLPAQSLEGRFSRFGVGGGAICGVTLEGTVQCPTWLSGDAVPDENLAAVSAGERFACGIRKATNELACWGVRGVGPCDMTRGHGQLDAPEGTFTAIVSRRFASCAIRTDRTLDCWGQGAADDDPNLFCDGVQMHLGQAVPPEGTFQSVTLGHSHGCGIRTNGTLACWGAGTADECPETGPHCRQSRPPEGVFAQVVAGTFHSCAMRADRTVVCWGGDGGEQMKTTPPEIFQ